MNGPTGFDRILADWLADAGAQDVPPRVVDAAVETARQTRRARPLPAFITRWLPMSTNFPAAPPLAVPRPMASYGPAIILLLALLALVIVGAALLSGGTSSPVAGAHNGLIAFDSNGDIWLADPDDGYAASQLTTTAAMETSPVWSPDGTRLAYWSREGAVSSIGIMDADGTVRHEITKPAGLDLPEGGEPRWSPDGRTVAVVAGSGFTTTVLIDADSGAAREFPVFVGLPTWSRDGSRVAWGDADSDPPGIHVAAADGSGDRSITSDGSNPVFTPDGDRIVFDRRSPTASDGDIVSIRLDAQDQRTIVGGVTNQYQPVVSPDGTLVAYLTSAATDVRDCCGSRPANVWVVPIGGDDEPRLVGSVLGDWGGLTWSPDGTRLAHFNMASDQIVVMSLDPTVDPVMIPSPGNVGILSWQRAPTS
jgi:Tol biopolymer transport system component